MSAFAVRYLDALSTAARALSVAGSPVAATLEELLAILEATRDCRECGVLHDNYQSDNCQHCAEEARREDARASTGEDLR